MREPSVLAEQTIVERKGDNRLDRQVHQVIHNQPVAIDDQQDAEPKAGEESSEPVATDSDQDYFG